MMMTEVLPVNADSSKMSDPEFLCFPLVLFERG